MCHDCQSAGSPVRDVAASTSPDSTDQQCCSEQNHNERQEQPQSLHFDVDLHCKDRPFNALSGDRAHGICECVCNVLHNIRHTGSIVEEALNEVGSELLYIAKGCPSVSFEAVSDKGLKRGHRSAIERESVALIANSGKM
jgi:hypothetical protein